MRCTVFTLSKGDQVFFGGNDDYIEPDTYYWVDPGQEGRYGAIWIGSSTAASPSGSKEPL